MFISCSLGDNMNTNVWIVKIHNSRNSHKNETREGLLADKGCLEILEIKWFQK